MLECGAYGGGGGDPFVKGSLCTGLVALWDVPGSRRRRKMQRELCARPAEKTLDMGRECLDYGISEVCAQMMQKLWIGVSVLSGC